MSTYRFSAKGLDNSGAKFSASGLLQAADPFDASARVSALVKATFGALPQTINVREKKERKAKR